MSKKNSSVILKNSFQEFKDLSLIFNSFKKKIDKLKKNSYAIAVSGGPDSLALVALSKAYSYQKKNNFKYILVNHNIRKNSFTEAKKVKKILHKLKINLVIISNTKKIDKNIQSNARKIRYEILTNFCIKHKIKYLLTAHNLEDQVETFFIRLSRGSGLKGLSSMKVLSKLNNKVKLLRPLLDIKKRQLIKISKIIFGNYIKDPSNQDNKFLRTKIRGLKIPLKKSGISYDQIYKSIKYLGSSDQILDKYNKKIIKETVIKFRGQIQIDLKKYEKLDEETKIIILNKSIRSLKKNYYNVRSKKITNLINSLNNQKFKKYTLGGCIFTKEKDKISLKLEK